MKVRITSVRYNIAKDETLIVFHIHPMNDMKGVEVLRLVQPQLKVWTGASMIQGVVKKIVFEKHANACSIFAAYPGDYHCSLVQPFEVEL